MKTILLILPLLLCAFSFRNTGYVGSLTRPAAGGGGGGASEFVFVQSQDASNDGGNVTSIVMDSAITAGRLVLVWIKHETGATATPTAVAESAGNSFTPLTEQTEAGGDLVGHWWYLLVADGGSATINITWTGTASFTRVIAQEFSYGGTASFVAEGNSSGNGTMMASGNISNSGTHRLNVAGYGGYDGAAVTSPLCGGNAADVEPNTQVADTWTWWNAVSISNGNASGTRGASERWVLNMICFAAN